MRIKGSTCSNKVIANFWWEMQCWAVHMSSLLSSAMWKWILIRRFSWQENTKTVHLKAKGQVGKQFIQKPYWREGISLNFVNLFFFLRKKKDRKTGKQINRRNYVSHRSFRFYLFYMNLGLDVTRCNFITYSLITTTTIKAPQSCSTLPLQSLVHLPYS